MAKKDAKLSRRDLLKSATVAGLGVTAHANTPAKALETLFEPHAAYASMVGVPFEKRDTVRLAIVGTGLRGRSVLGEFLAIDNVQLVALCDIVEEKCRKAADMVTKAGQRLAAVAVTPGDEKGALLLSALRAQHFVKQLHRLLHAADKSTAHAQ